MRSKSPLPEGHQKVFTLHPGQARLLEDKQKTEHALIGGYGVGKCLELLTILPTPTGFTTMGEVAAGDQLFDERGEICTVVEAHEPFYAERCYRVTFDDGTEVVTDAEHRWRTWDRNTKLSFKHNNKGAKEFPQEWPTWRRPGVGQNRYQPGDRDRMRELIAAGRSYEEIGAMFGRQSQEIKRQARRPDIELAEPNVRTTEELLSTLGYGKESNHCIPAARGVDLPAVKLPIDPYVLGYLLGDGDTVGQGRVACHQNDRSWLMDEFARLGHLVSDYNDDIHFGIRGIARDWRELDLHRGKHIPPEYLRASFEQRLSLIQGLTDSDGSVNKKGHYLFFNSEQRLVEDFIELASSLGLIAKSFYRPARLTPQGNLGKPSWIVTIASELPLARLPRKIDKARRSWSLRQKCRYVVSIEPVEPRMVRCITVDSPNSLFLCTRAFIPTMNTTFGPRWHMKRVVDNRNSQESLVVAPNNRLLKNRCMVEFVNFLKAINMREGRGGDYQIYLSQGDLKLQFRWGHTIHFLSGAAPENIVSYNASHIWIDEPAIMDIEVVLKVIGRLRCPLALYSQILYTGTPEGMNWFYDRFHPDMVIRQPGTPFSENETKLVLHGKSHDNPYLSNRYLKLLEEEYGFDLAYYSNYVLGEWTTLSRTRFYYTFVRSKHVGDYPPMTSLKRLILTFDNNVGCMTWVALQPFQGTYIAIKDNGGRGKNIEDACYQFREAFPPAIWRDHSIQVLGDASLWNRSTHSNGRGYELIREFLKPHYPHIYIDAPNENPSVNDRNVTTNRLFAKNRLLVDFGCKKLIQSAERVEFEAGGGVKKGRHDDVTHAMEAVDMALVYLEPTIITREFRGIK